MTFLQNLTDDQTAILGCSVLLLVAFFLGFQRVTRTAGP